MRLMKALTRPSAMRRSSQNGIATEDEDSSNHSTVSTGATALLKQCYLPSNGALQSDLVRMKSDNVLTSCANPRESSRVTFNLAKNEIILNKKEESEVSCCWYSQNEYRLFKKCAVFSARKIVSQANFVQVVAAMYNACCAVPQDYEIDDDRNEPILNLTDQMKFQACVSEKTDRIGLERIVVKTLLLDIKERRQSMMERIKAIQEEKALPAAAKHEMIRRCVTRLSLPNRIFALEKARAVSDLCFL